MTDFLKATATKGGHKVLRISPLGKGYSVTVEDKSYAAGHCTYMVGSSGKVSSRNKAFDKYALEKPAAQPA